MAVAGVGATASSTGAATAAVKATADYETFLKLLVAEMKNQDPTNPMDSTQYVAQLASFSQVEQSVQVNAKLEQLLQSSALSQADAIIGRTVISLDGSVTGVVKEVKLYTDGIAAILENGTQVPIVPGVTIR